MSGAMALRIAIDATSAAKPTRTGVGRYIAQLVDALVPAAPDARFDLWCRLSRFKTRAHRLAVPDSRVRRRWWIEPWARRLAASASVFHGPDARLPRLDGVPMVATVHDTFSADSAAFADAGFREKKNARYADIAARAAAVIAPSAHTKSRFIAHTSIDPARVHVVPHGVDPMFHGVAADAVAATKARYGLPRDYAFYIGQLSTRKNLDRVATAFARADTDLDLVLAGPRSHGVDAIDAAIDAAGLGGRVHRLGPVPDTALPALYAGARMHLLLSLDEGFGMPVLEAFAAGTPVVAADRGALPEVAGDAAELADPEDVDAMARAIERIAGDAALRERRVAAGRARAADFTWSRAAERTLAVYRSVADA